MPDLSYWGSDAIWTNPKEGGRTPSRVYYKCACGKRHWSTKNIGYFGARTIYYQLGSSCPWMAKFVDYTPECTCPTSDLSVDVEIMEHLAECEICSSGG